MLRWLGDWSGPLAFLVAGIVWLVWVYRSPRPKVKKRPPDIWPPGES